MFTTSYVCWSCCFGCVCVVDINVLLCGTMHDASEYIEMVNVLF